MGTRWILVTRTGVGMGTILYPWQIWVFKWKYLNIADVGMEQGNPMGMHLLLSLLVHSPFYLPSHTSLLGLGLAEDSIYGHHLTTISIIVPNPYSCFGLGLGFGKDQTEKYACGQTMERKTHNHWMDKKWQWGLIAWAGACSRISLFGWSILMIPSSHNIMHFNFLLVLFDHFSYLKNFEIIVYFICNLLYYTKYVKHNFSFFIFVQIFLIIQVVKQYK